MSKQRMLEKLKLAYTTALDIMLLISKLEESLLREDEELVRRNFKELKTLVEKIIHNTTEENNGYK